VKSFVFSSSDYAQGYKSGNFKVIWDGKDDQGDALSSGIYFTRLKTEKVVLNKKMILMK
jgi:hypothetical protein